MIKIIHFRWVSTSSTRRSGKGLLDLHRLWSFERSLIFVIVKSRYSQVNPCPARGRGRTPTVRDTDTTPPPSRPSSGVSTPPPSPARWRWGRGRGSRQPGTVSTSRSPGPLRRSPSGWNYFLKFEKSSYFYPGGRTSEFSLPRTGGWWTGWVKTYTLLNLWHILLCINDASWTEKLGIY